MTGRQKRFCEFYVQSGNVYQSAVQAGYSEAYAKANSCKLLENVSVSEYIRQLTEKAQDERILTAKEQQATLSDIARNPENAPSDRTKAIDVLNKMTGEYTVRVEADMKPSEKFADILKQVGGGGLAE